MATEDDTTIEPDDTGAGDIQVDDATTPLEPAKPTPPAPVPTPRPAPVVDSWKPPTKDEWDTVISAHREASSESKKRKEALRALQAQIEELKTANATAEERAALELEKRLLTEAEAKWRPKVIAVAAKAALVEAGCKNPARISVLIKTDKIEVDDDGTVTGLDEQVAALKAELPEVFKRERPPEPQAAQPGSTRVPDKKRTATERQAAALLGKP